MQYFPIFPCNYWSEWVYRFKTIEKCLKLESEPDFNKCKTCKLNIKKEKHNE